MPSQNETRVAVFLGGRSPEHDVSVITGLQALKALDLTLSADDLAAVEAAVPAGAVAGDRYAPAQMATLDAER